MEKEEFIRRYGEEAYEKLLEQNRERNKRYREEHPEEAKAAVEKWREGHPEEAKAADKKYLEQHPERVKAIRHEQHRKGGKYYDRNLKNEHSGLRGDRNKIRSKHAHQYKPYKDIIAPESQIHHEWVPKTAEYRGVALVEKDPHQYGIVDVIEILDGAITLLTEEEVKRVRKRNDTADVQRSDRR